MLAPRPAARIWWDQSGTGDPILLIMGHAYGAGMWHRTVPELAASYRVIRFDNRGAGRRSRQLLRRGSPTRKHEPVNYRRSGD